MTELELAETVSYVEQLEYISYCLYRINCLFDICLAVGLMVLFVYMFYSLLKWFTRF